MVFHHAAITYGASGGWYWRERTPGTVPLLTLFTAMNQAWFMGMFFLLAGRFTLPAYEAKGARRFLLDRACRLGLPLLATILLLDPLCNVLARPDPNLWDWLARIGRPPYHPGVLWFAEALLAFSLAYVGLRSAGLARPCTLGLPGNAIIAAAAILVGAVSFLVRLAYPTGRSWMDLLPAYFPAYLLLFAAGLAGAPSDWLGRVPGRRALAWLAVSLLALFGLLLAVRLPGPPSFDGGWSVKAAIMAFWEPFFGWGVILGLLWLFTRRLNTPSRWSAWAARRAYASYVIHPPLLIAVARLLHPWEAGPLLKTAASGALACAACLAVSSLLLASATVRRVL